MYKLQILGPEIVKTYHGLEIATGEHEIIELHYDTRQEAEEYAMLKKLEGYRVIISRDLASALNKL